MKYSAHQFTKVVSVFKPDAYASGAGNSTGIDCKGFREILFVVDYGTAGTSLDFKVQSSSDDGSNDAYADISGAAITQLTSGAELALIRIDCTQVERYLRGVRDGVGTNDYGVIAVLMDPITPPSTQTADETVNVHS